MPAILERLEEGVETDNAACAQAWAGAFAQSLPPDTVLALKGELGAGKTNWVKGMASAWGIPGPVTSPTFNLYTIYQGQRQLVHLDAYRLETEAEAESLMLEDFLRSPWCLAVEWPEHIGDFLPSEAWQLHFTILTPGRHRVVLKHTAQAPAAY
jgi:tRNA threonylcarbamoyladenosine biosynthesis protein TsaE